MVDCHEVNARLHILILGALKVGPHTPDNEKLPLIALHLYKLYSTTAPYEVFPDALTFLQNLQKINESRTSDAVAKIKLGVISNTDKRLSNISRDLGISRYFDFMILSEECKCSKPDSDIFEEAARSSGLEKLNGDEILHVGDDLKKDFFAAKNIGWNALIIQREKTQKQEQSNQSTTKSDGSHEGSICGADSICNSFSEVESKLFPSLVS